MLLPSFLGFFFSSQIFPQLQDWHFITWLPKSEIAGITRKDFAWKGEERKLFMITSVLLKKIDKIERIVPKKTHYLYFDARRHNTATIFKWANRKNQTRKLSLSPLKQLYASPSFMLRVCTLPYLKSECFFASCWKGLENMVSHRFPCFIVFFYFVGHFSNL